MEGDRKKLLVRPCLSTRLGVLGTPASESANAHTHHHIDWRSFRLGGLRKKYSPT